MATTSAPPATQALAASVSSVAAPSQSPASWQARTSAKSSDCIVMRADAWPPSWAATASLMIR